MIHTIYDKGCLNSLEVDETLCENTCISISNDEDASNESGRFIYLNPNQLNDLIGLLLHVQAKKRKQYKTGY